MLRRSVCGKFHFNALFNRIRHDRRRLIDFVLRSDWGRHFPGPRTVPNPGLNSNSRTISHIPPVITSNAVASASQGYRIRRSRPRGCYL
jgi:hypothetical protein